MKLSCRHGHHDYVWTRTEGGEIRHCRNCPVVVNCRVTPVPEVSGWAQPGRPSDDWQGCVE